MSERDPEVVAVAREWLDVAEGDLAAARLLLNAGGPAFAVCFHAQQAVEKYLKALLVVNAARSRYPEATAPSHEEAHRLLQYVAQVREFVRRVLPSDLREP